LIFLDDAEEQKDSLYLRIIEIAIVGWGMAVAVFMVGTLSLVILFPPALGIYHAITDDFCVSVAPHNATIDIGGASLLRVVGERGEISIKGAPGLTAVQVQGEVCATRESRHHVDSVLLSTAQNGDEIIVSVDMPKSGSRLVNDIRMNLEILVPEEFIGVVINHVEGPVTVSGVRDLRVAIGYGNLEAADIAGSVVVTELEGSMSLTDIGGNVTVSTILGYGEVDLNGISGNVTIGENRSGPARISNIGGDVTIGSSGYGQLSVIGVAGDLSVGENPRGALSFDRIEGSVRLPEELGSGGGPGA
jgi:hypothetical protein